MIKIKYIVLMTFIGSLQSNCQAQKDSSLNANAIYTEYQYYIYPKNDTIILHLFKMILSKETLSDSQKGMIFLTLELDLDGNVTKVIFKKNNNFELSENEKGVLRDEIIQQVKYEVKEEARNFYITLDKPIIFDIVIMGKNLQETSE